MNLFLTLNEDPLKVIGLFPNLLPSSFAGKFEYPCENASASLSLQNFNSALSSLVEYLTKVRGSTTITTSSNPSLNKDFNTTSDSQVLLDTILLKIQIKMDLDVFPLLSSPNKCDVQITENLLLNAAKFRELVEFYQSRELHKKALELLKKVGNPNERPKEGIGKGEDILGTSHTIKYLSALSEKHLGLILEFSRWVLEIDPSSALSIFTTQRNPHDDLPHKEIYEHIKSVTSTQKENLAMQYLEFIIDKRGETDSWFHNELIFVYLELVTALKSILPPSSESSKSEAKPKAGTEHGLLGIYRRKLLSFLENSVHYKAETMLSRFPNDDLYEEKAILLSRIGAHYQALFIYAYKLNDTLAAEQYCAKHFEHSEDGKDVYLSLLKVYLAPPDSLPIREGPALELLNKHYKRMDFAKALELIPASFTIHQLYTFFESVLQENVITKRNNQVFLSILKSQELIVREQHAKSRSRVIKIWENTACPICERPLQNAVFAAYPISKKNPHGKVVHLACFKKEDKSNN